MGQPRREPQTPDGLEALAQLRSAGPEGLDMQVLRDLGMRMPAQALYDVEMSGWAVERRGSRVWLRAEDDPRGVVPKAPPRVRRLTRGG